MASRVWVYSLLGGAAITAWVAAPSPLPSGPSGDRQIALASKQMPIPGAIRRILPAELERPVLEAAGRDPFALLAPPVIAPLPQKPVRVEAPPPPSPPPLNLRFTGKMTAPDGSQVIFVALGETPLSLTVGQTLPNGYKVNAINDRTVELSYLPMNFTTRFDLPAPPLHEIR